ncbi:uncharacterized protein LOC110024445 [Phalaenopsis equestris]|uniref:uncharacterized protein LOC110024445 n=1 Tax=Phalaenopsis equestris TaxID=78828 RepID=UPI0009E19D73|nr:uncharacterized protein LOC110024445 [Phalaenopsis equestris]
MSSSSEKIYTKLFLFSKTLKMALSVILLLFTQLLLLQTQTTLALPSVQRGDQEIKALARPHHKIFHPPTNSCIYRHYQDPLTLSPCDECDSWNYTPQKFLTVVGTYYCLKATGAGLPAKLVIACDVSDSQWTPLLGSQNVHLSTQLADGTVLCLDVDDDNNIVTNPCRSFSSDSEAANGDSQWFEINTFSYRKA